jgi:hypothetical protein
MLSALVLQSYLLNLTPLLGVPIGGASIVVWTIAGGGLLVRLVRRGFPTVTSDQWRILSTALVVPVTGAAAFAAIWLHRHGHWIGWSMQGDTAYRTSTTLRVVQDHGLVVRQGVPDPLTTVINATWSAQGITDSGISRSLGTQLLHMVTMSEQAWILTWLSVSFVVATIAQRRGASLGARLGAIFVALMPWTWFMAGLAAVYGFQNVGPTVLVLLLTYVVAQAAFRHPIAGVTGLIMATVAGVMAWAPLAAYPAVWLVVLSWRARDALRRCGRLCLFPLAALVAALIYADRVTLREMRSQPASALANDGAIEALSCAAGVTVAVCVVALAWRTRRRHPENWTLTVTAAPLGLLVVLGLMMQRRHAATLWGYYPIKFTWLSLTLALLVAAATAVADLRRAKVGAPRRWTWAVDDLAAAAAAVVIAGGAMAVLSPPLSHDAQGVFAPEALRTNTVDERPAEQLLAILNRHPKSFVTLYNVGPQGVRQDGFMNMWLFQMTATSPTDPVRYSAYQYDPSKPKKACTSIATWGPGVTVWTTRSRVRAILARNCGSNLGYKAEVLPQFLPSLR